MAFTPQYYSHIFSNEFNSSLPAGEGEGVSALQICNSQVTPSSVLYDNNNIEAQLLNINSLPDHYVPPSISNSMMPWFPERLGVVSDMTVPALLPAPASSSDTFSSDYSFNSTTTHHVYAADQHEACESCWDETTTRLDHHSSFNNWSRCPLATSNNWGPQRETSPKVKETPAMKIGRYSEEERKDRILRYLKKRNQRNFNKTIKYACRKTLADKRVRVRGRFAKNNEVCDDEKGINDICHGSKDARYDNPFQMKHPDQYEENWLEEAITNLMYIPYIGSSYDHGGMSVERFMS
ncbi:uncharacterized protein [Nicotiana tomentosiformis]|uniref:uncharacterized protein n=1 Tax=Nicotiana tomentosiformis TaxID=4098 RepID=UPI00051BDA88|nr:uncharacterized protein LOC104102504 [Nicotiana tomentosiformis]